MTLKEKLEIIWNRPGVIHACHINRWVWGDGEYWRDNKIGAQRKIILCLKGRRTPRLGPRPKGKGYVTWLCKNYGMYSRMRIGK